MKCKICYKETKTEKNKFCSRECYINFLKIDIRSLNHLKKISSIGGKTRWKNHNYCYYANGYIMIKVPSHPNANKRGYVYKHRLIMEKYLGRYLSPIEVVHHKNGDKLNNDINNLILFHNTNQHSSYHGLRGDTSRCKMVNMLDRKGNIINIFRSITEANYKFGKPKNWTGINRCCKNKTKISLGYKWKYHNKKEVSNA